MKHYISPCPHFFRNSNNENLKIAYISNPIILIITTIIKKMLGESHQRNFKNKIVY